jgi:hypothetical protein
LGFTGLGSGDMKLYEVLKNILFTNSATTGEAAGLAIGILILIHRNGFGWCWLRSTK